MRSQTILSLASAVSVLSAAGYRRFQQDIDAAKQRVSSGSRVATTCRGPIEYAQLGNGRPLLIVHGAGGGYDQGLLSAEPLAQRGFCVTAMSRFGYLRTPLPADASPQAQADAHASLLEALGIQKTAVIATSAGAPSALQFAIRHPHRCTALALLVPLTWQPNEPADSAAKLAWQARLLLPWIVGSDPVFWLALRFARNLLIKTVLGTPPSIIMAASRSERAQIDAALHCVLPLSSRAAGMRNDARIAAALVRYELEAIRAPMLVVSVRDDLFGTFAAAQYTATQVPGSRFIGYDRGGHLCVGHHAALLDEIAWFATHA